MTAFESATELNPGERQALERIMRSGGKPLWKHMLSYGPLLCFFWGCTVLLPRVPTILESNLVLCRRWGATWIPEPEGLVKLFKMAGSMLVLASFALTYLVVMRINEHRRMYAILSRRSPAENA